MTSVTWADRADAHAVADHVARVVAQPGARPGAPPGARTIAVPGGQTPLPILDALARRALDWAGTTIVPTDDRQVPPDHPASNHGLLARTLGATGATVRPLDDRFKPTRFDLVWIGMGADGHVASLFPNAPETLQAGAGVLSVTPDPLPPEAPFPRLTLTLDALADCGDMIVVIAGEAKRRVMADALAGRSDLPVARLLQRLSAPLTLYWTP